MGQTEASKQKGLIASYRDLDVYQMAMEAAIRIFELTKAFPPEERYSLVDQMRRASRSVCSNHGRGVAQAALQSGVREQTERFRGGSSGDAGMGGIFASLRLLGPAGL